MPCPECCVSDETRCRSEQTAGSDRLPYPRSRLNGREIISLAFQSRHGRTQNILFCRIQARLKLALHTLFNIGWKRGIHRGGSLVEATFASANTTIHSFQIAPIRVDFPEPFSPQRIVSGLISSRAPWRYGPRPRSVIAVNRNGAGSILGGEESVMNGVPIDQQGIGVRSSTRTRLSDARKVALSLRDRKRGRGESIRSWGTMNRHRRLVPRLTIVTSDRARIASPLRPVAVLLQEI